LLFIARQKIIKWGGSLFLWVWLIASIGGAAVSHAAVDIDIRSSGVLLDGQQEISYIATVSDCADLISIAVAAGDAALDVSPAETTRIEGSAGGCRLQFSGTGDGRFNPQVILNFSDGSSQTHSEIFEVEKNAPQLVFDAVKLAAVEGRQYLLVTADAGDDVDISYVGIEATGLRASDLRVAGGVVARAREQAFAATGGQQRIYPRRDDQQRFELSLELSSELSAAAVAHDGVVLVDMVAVDASGNQTALSKISFTGEDVVETAADLQVQPARIVFTNLLETAALTPSVDYQFRGRTPLPGPGTGVSYTSSHPELIAVTAGGIVYPLAETTDESVTIAVSYPGLDPVTLPVEVDLNKYLTALKVEPLNAQEQWVLERLNGWFAWPNVVGVFDQPPTAEISSQFQLEFFLDEGASGIIEIDPKNGLRAKAIVPSASPAQLTVRLKHQPDVLARVPVVAVDALPEVKLDLPGQVKAGHTLSLSAEAGDDVGVAEVRFFMNGAEVGARRQPPYELALEIPETLIDEILVFHAVALDTAGQQNQTPDRPVKVVADLKVQVPAVDAELPAAMQRFVEGSPIRFQVALETGGYSGSGISYVEFFLDGKLMGQSHFPLYEERPIGPGQTATFEVWRLDGLVGAISTSETSAAFHAVTHTRSGGQGTTEARLIRIIENTPPAVQITAPVPGASASVGQTVDITAELADDTLALGMSVALYLNGEAVDLFRHEDADKRFAGSFGVQKTSHTFAFPVVEEMLGTSLRFHLEAVDFHGLVSKTEELVLPVKADQPPSVAVSNPVDGAHFVSGLPIDIRADATDDIRVQRVDFYVSDRLAGSDTRRPYGFQYETLDGLAQEQSLKIFAVAVDSRGQEARSADVFVTLGKDEQPPVVNIVSPEITATEGGESLAEVIENSEVVVKIAGYDNVAVDRLELRGIEQRDSQYVLTGNPEHVLTGDAFAPQQIPGALHAFSALKLVLTPVFFGADGLEHNRYPVEVTAVDRTGNSSTASMVIAVGPDHDPVIVRVGSDRERYFAKDTVTLDIQARDDLAVTILMVDYYVDGADTSVLSTSRELGIPAANVQETFVLDLAALPNISNASHTVRAAVAAVDNRGRRSDAGGPFNFEFQVAADTRGPLAGISQPIQGSALYHGETVTFHWKAVDESPLGTIQFLVDGSPIHSRNLSTRSQSGQFSYTLPAAGEELLINLVVSDVFFDPSSTELDKNRSSTNWRYSLVSDEPPEISIRNPAQGSRLIEGEPFTLTAAVTDNRTVQSAVFFIEQGGQTLFSKTFSAAAVASAQADGRYLSAGMRVPHRPEGQQAPITIGVRATDDAGLSAEALLDMEILDDLEPPASAWTGRTAPSA